MLQGSKIENYIHRFSLLLSPFLIFIILTGCETDPQRITGNVRGRTPGEYGVTEIQADSIYVSQTFSGDATDQSRILVGDYSELRSFSVIRFPLLSISRAYLTGAVVRLTLDQVYPSGSQVSLSLYHTTATWTDSTFNPDLFPEGGIPIPALSDTTDVLTFSIDPALITSAGNDISFVIRSNSANFLASIYSANSSVQPILGLKRSTSADTTFIRCANSAYSVNSPYPQGTPVVSEYRRDGFVLKVGMPDSLIPDFAAINRAYLTLDFTGKEASSGFNVNAALLTEPFEELSDIQIDNSTVKTFSITTGTSSQILDLAPFMNKWRNGEKPNYGILFWSADTAVTLKDAVITPQGPVTVSYTSIPEVN